MMELTLEQRVERLEDNEDSFVSSLGSLLIWQEKHASAHRAMKRRLTTIEERLNGVDGRLDGIDGRLDGIDGRLDGIDGRLDGIDGRLDAMDGQLGELRELTRSILDLLKGGTQKQT